MSSRHMLNHIYKCLTDSRKVFFPKSGGAKNIIGKAFFI
jgi:hypothetical protein